MFLLNEVKIDSDLSNNFFDVYNEARGIAINKSRILKNKKLVGMNYISYIFIIFICIFILNMFLILDFRGVYIGNFALIVLILDILFLIIGLARIYISYFYRKNSNFVSTVFINRRGICDISSFHNMELLFLWDRIEGVVIGHYSVVIFVGGTIYLYFSIKDKKKIIDGIKRFKKDILVVK